MSTIHEYANAERKKVANQDTVDELENSKRRLKQLRRNLRNTLVNMEDIKLELASYDLIRDAYDAVSKSITVAEGIIALELDKVQRAP